ncbi:Lrp/AsnC family transcriptional regulator [Nonomuraea terrae]|uniref:Lrp/AsnC family transcriptional regulator n=1 Tax=Nonomuraea terrae TaxID=2530383 RepID=A0A4R4Z033_9ACTN|nr:Lrp/AsnC family transcriptional regulator [Nonomuraea terrae]
MDAIDLALLARLAKDGRASLTDLAREVGLSRPSVAERLRKLESTGVITGYAARIDPTRLGLPLRAHVRLRPHQPNARAHGLREKLLALGHVLSCVHVTGDDCYVIEVAARSPSHLEEMIDSLTGIGRTTTLLVLSDVVSLSDVDIKALLRAPDPESDLLLQPESVPSSHTSPLLPGEQ